MSEEADRMLDLQREFDQRERQIEQKALQQGGRNAGPGILVACPHCARRFRSVGKALTCPYCSKDL